MDVIGLFMFNENNVKIKIFIFNFFLTMYSIVNEQLKLASWLFPELIILFNIKKYVGTYCLHNKYTYLTRYSLLKYFICSYNF